MHEADSGLFFFNFFYGFTWDDPVNEEIPNSTQANFKGFPGTDSNDVIGHAIATF